MKTKLHQLQCKLGAIKKDSENPFFNSAYFDINQLIHTLKPLLEEIGLTILQPLRVNEKGTMLYTIIQDSETGEDIAASAIYLPELNDPQKLGSAITYFRRYSLQSMLLLEAEDDDGNSTKPKVKKEVNEATGEVFSCDSCKSTNVKHLKGTSKKTGKPYDFYSCQDCKFTMN